MWKERNLNKKEDIFIKDLAKILKVHFKINSTVRKINSFSKRKDGKTTQPTRIYILGDSVKRFVRLIGFEGNKQKTIKRILENV